MCRRTYENVSGVDENLMPKMKKISVLWNKYKSEIIVGVTVTFICNIISGVKNWILNESPKIGVNFFRKYS